MQVLPTVASISSPESDRRIGHEAEANTEGRHTKVCKARYQTASWKGICAGYWLSAQICNFSAKYHSGDASRKKLAVRQRRRIYNEEVQQSFLTVWNAANKICPKRLIPFLPKFVESLERHGHLSMPLETRERLLRMSAATADRILKTEREQARKSISTTRAGSL